MDSDEDARRMRIMVFEQQALTRELRRQVRSLRRLMGVVLGGVGLALAVGGLWLGLRTTSFGSVVCGHPLAATNRAFGDTPPSDDISTNDIPVNDCLVWLSATRGSTVALLICGGVLVIAGLGVATYRRPPD